MDNIGYTIEEVPVTKIEKLYTCTECGFKVLMDSYEIRSHCAKHRIERVKIDTEYKAPVRVITETEGRGFSVDYVGSAVFKSEEQADELCYLLQATADYYLPRLAEVKEWQGPGKYMAVSTKVSGMGQTTESIMFTKEKL